MLFAHRETEAVGGHGRGQAPPWVDAQRLSQECRQLWASDNKPPISAAVKYHAMRPSSSIMDRMAGCKKLEWETMPEVATVQERQRQEWVDGIEAPGRGHLSIRESREGAQHAAVQRHLQLRRPLLHTAPQRRVIGHHAPAGNARYHA